MFQRFHDTSMFSNLIKNLLSSEPIPVYQVLKNTDVPIPGCCYVFEDTVIQCLNNSKNLNIGTLLAEQIDSSASRYIEFMDRPAYTVKHISNVRWYDTDTHVYLGNYLRYLRDVKGLDLLKFYNCYAGIELTDVYLDSSKKSSLVCREGLYPQPEPQLFCGTNTLTTNDKTYRFGSKLNSKVLAIPIKFDTDYTIAIESPNTVSLRAVIYNSRTGMVKKNSSERSYYSDDLEYTSRSYAHTQFNKPFHYRVDLASLTSGMSTEKKQALYSRQDELYLLIQVKSDLNSSIVVLEGTYNDTTYTQVYGLLPSDGIQEVVRYSDNLSLLHYNTGVSYAFSDRLVEYVLQNVVSPLETLPLNISRVQTSLSLIDTSYQDRLRNKSAIPGVWDEAIPVFIHRFLEENKDQIEHSYDQDGNINKDIEHLLSLKGVYFT